MKKEIPMGLNRWVGTVPTFFMVLYTITNGTDWKKSKTGSNTIQQM